MKLSLHHFVSLLIAICLIYGGILPAKTNGAEIVAEKIYVIGTSITCGHNGTGDYGHDPDPAYYSHDIGSHQYPYWVDYYMNASYGLVTNISDTYGNCSWDKYNLGTGGGSTPVDVMDDIINGNYTWFNNNREGWRVPDNPSDIDIFIVEGGHHDLNVQGDTVDELNSDLYDLYNFTHAHGIKIILCTMTPDYRASMHQAINQTNVWRRNFAAAHDDVWLADFFNSSLAKWNAEATDWEPNETLYSEPDGSEVHPNEDGYKVMGEIAAATLNSILSGETEEPHFSETLSFGLVAPLNYEDGILPPPDDFTAEAMDMTTIELSWVNDPHADRTVIRQVNGSYTGTWDHTTGEQIYNGTGESFLHSVEEQSTHSYGAWHWNATLGFSDVVTAENTSYGGNDLSPPTADFSWTADGLNVSFTDTSTDIDGSIVNWTWDFGDGNVSYQQNPTHVYGADGSYNVTLNVIDNDTLVDDITKEVVVSSGSSGVVEDGGYNLLLYLFGGLAVGCPLCALIYYKLSNGGRK